LSSNQRVERFMERVFAQGEIYTKALDSLCADGCEREKLCNVLFGTCTVAKFWTRRLADIHSYWHFLGLADITDPQLKRLPDDLRTLADRIERINKTPLAPQQEILLGPSAPEKQGTRDAVVQLYKILPTIMRLYGQHFERFSAYTSEGFGRLTNTHILVSRILFAVEQATGSPHYEDVADLLQAGYRAASGSQSEVPRFFTAEALAKLKQRNPVNLPFRSVEKKTVGE
jgi:hypothetical protein